MFKRSVVLIGSFLFVNILLASENSLVWVFFKDKGFRDKFTYSEALVDARNSLSREAIRRREKVLPAEKVVGWRDLPVCYRYIEKIKSLGAHHRVSSNWLNCASFEMPFSIVEKVRSLPFVKDIRDVAVYIKKVPKIEISPPEGRHIKAPQFFDYGISYDQLNMLGVPEAHARGYTGAGVRIGILDTGFELNHTAFQQLHLVAEHDFLSGEWLWFEGMSTPVNYYQIEQIDGWEDPRGGVYVAFQTIDSSLNREIYYTGTQDGGISWSDPVNVSCDTVQPEGHPAHPSILSYGDSVLVAWQDDYPLRAVGWYEEDIFVWSSAQDTIINVSQDVVASLLPVLTGTPGNFHLVWTSANTLRYAKSIDGLNWNTATAKVLTNPITALSFGSYEDSLFVALTDTTHQLWIVESFDGGSTWRDTAITLNAESPDISVSGGKVHLVYKNREDLPFYNISYLYRDSNGWRQPIELFSKPSSAIGGVKVGSSEDSVWVIYEDHGYICLLRWNAGTSPTPGLVADTLTPNGFCYSPQLTQNGRKLWKSCGDDTTRDQEDLGDIPGQQYHGTAMLSLIGGYAPSQLYGPAFNSEFILAKTEKISTADGDDFEYEVEEDWWVKGLEWAEGLGVDIVSSSLGYRFVNWEGLDGNTAVTTRAADIAANLGVLVVNAVGNRREHIVSSPQDWLVAPSDADSILAVGATDIYGDYDGMAAYGPLVDGRDKPEVATYHFAIIAYYEPPDSFGFISGTSCATALIAGMCALVLEANPSWTNQDLREAVMYTSSLARTVNPDTLEFGQTPNDSLGWGVPNVILAMNYRGNKERIVDGGLENWKTPSKLSIWKILGDSAEVRTVSQESDSNNVYEGMYSAKISTNNNLDSSSVGIYQDIKTGKRCEYQFRCWVKYATRTSGKVRVQIYDLEDSLLIGSWETDPQADWVLLEFKFVTSSPSTRVEVILAEETRGDAWVDSISVWYLGSVPELPPEFEEKMVRIFPNPVVLSSSPHGAIHFEYVLMNHAIPRLRIYTLSGRLVEEIEMGERTPGRYSYEWIPPSNLASGVYIATFITGFTTSSQKFAVIR